MHNRPALTYRYDGSFEGLLCCVHESVYKRELPDVISGAKAQQLSLFACKTIQTDGEKAQKVLHSIAEKISADAQTFVKQAFLTCLETKERDILLFLYKGYRQGHKVLYMLADPVVDRLSKAVRQLKSEAHNFCGFVRFSMVEDAMVAQIKPKNFVLPLLAPHFCNRFPGENFLIHDQTHEALLIHENGKLNLQMVDSFEMMRPDEEELAFRRLWKMYYDTIAVEGRYNPTCRRSLMPKRYWQNMTEFASGNLGTKEPLRVDRVKVNNFLK